MAAAVTAVLFSGVLIAHATSGDYHPREAAFTAATDYIGPLIGAPGDTAKVTTFRCRGRGHGWWGCRTRIDSRSLTCRIVFWVRSENTNWTIYARRLACGSSLDIKEPR